MTKRDLTSDLYADARRYISRNFGDVDMSSLPQDAVRRTVDQLHPGGWQDFEADFMKWNTTTSAVVKTEEWSPVKVRIKVAQMLGKRFLKAHDEVKSFSCTDTDIKFVVSIATVDERSRRDIITARTIQLHTFHRDAVGEEWTHDMIDVTEDVREESIRFGSAMTPERYEAMMEQYETCYRPGTSRVPMAGWVARAEMSWRDAHADEDFQTTSDSTTN